MDALVAHPTGEMVAIPAQCDLAERERRQRLRERVGEATTGEQAAAARRANCGHATCAVTTRRSHRPRRPRRAAPAYGQQIVGCCRGRAGDDDATRRGGRTSVDGGAQALGSRRPPGRRRRRCPRHATHRASAAVVACDRATSVRRYPSRANRRATDAPSPGPAPTTSRWLESTAPIATWLYLAE